MLLRLPIKFPKLTILLIMAITGLSLITLKDLTPDNDLEVWFRQSDPALQLYQKYRETFGNDLTFMVFYRSEDLFARQALTLNRKLTNEFSGISNIIRATSITNAKKLSPNLIGPRFPVPIINENYANPERAKQLLLNNEFYRDSLISIDGKVTAIILEKSSTNIEQSSKLLDEIRGVLSKKEYSGNEYHIIGGLPIVVELNRLSEKESRMFGVISILTISLLLITVFGNPAISLLPLMVGAISVSWSLGLYVLNGNTLNMISLIIPSIVLFTSIACSIHVITHYLREVSHQEADRYTAIEQVTKKLVKPCLFASLTTITALLSFSVSDTPPVRQLAIYGSTGVWFSFVMSFSLLPAVLVLHRRPVKRFNDSFCHRFIRKILNDLVSHVENYHKVILIFFALIFCISSLGLRNINFEGNQIGHLRKDNPTYVAHSRMLEWFRGVYTVDLMLQSEKSGYFLTPEGLKTIKLVSTRVEEDPEVRKTISIFTFYKNFYNALTGDGEDVPPVAMGSKSILDMLGKSSGPVSKFVSDDSRTTRVSVRCKWLSASEAEELMERLNDGLAEICRQRGIRSDFSGIPALVVNFRQNIIKSQIASIAISFTLIFLILWVLFRKLKIAVLGMVPNVLPIVFSLGLMSWSGLNMDVGTILIAATTLGISVDDTIHFLFFYGKANNAGMPRKTLLKKVLASVGPPIILTSLFLAAGFSLMVFSSFQPLLYFGGIVALSVLMALICDLVLLPSLLMNNRQRSTP